MSSGSMVKDFTSGRVGRQLLLFSIPFILSNVLQTGYNLIDMAIVGRYVGSVGLSAVSNGGEVLQLLTFIGIGFSGAGQVVISQFSGVKDHHQIQRTVGTLFTFIGVLSLVFTAISLLLAEPLLAWLNVPEQAVEQALGYTRIGYTGTFFIFGYNCVSSILRGMGDGKRPLVFIAIATVTNLVLDILFVGVLSMEAQGAAYATVIGQAVAFIASLTYLYKKRDTFGFDFAPRSFLPDRQILFLLIKLGIPMALQLTMVSISMLFVTSLVNVHGLVASAVTGVGNKLRSVNTVVTAALHTAGSAMIGQNIAAGKHERVSRIVQIIFLVGVACAAVLSVVMLLFPRQIFSIWTSEVAVLDMAKYYAPVAVLNFIGSATRAPCIALVNGIGFASFGLFMGLLDGFVARVGLAYLCGVVLGFGIQGLWYGSVIAGFVYIFLVGPYFLSGKWKTRKPIIESVEPGI